MGTIATPLLSWFDHHGRHNLPWQQLGKHRQRNAYHVWISEIMLQQTQVATVIPYFQRFITALPTLPDLAQADEDTVLALWSGLGYYRRARFLRQAAQICVSQHAGTLPCDVDALIALPGIGRSTAGAILAQTWGLPFPILDGNVKRVLTRYHGIHGEIGKRVVEKQLWEHAHEHTPLQRVADYTQAMMDLGATVCVRTRPRCNTCPLHTTCIAHRDNLVSLLPHIKSRKPLPTRATIMLVLRDRHQRILLERRGPQGVWSGLWSLPEADNNKAAWRIAKEHASIHNAQVLDPFTHVFSHYQLHITPWLFDNVSAHFNIADNAPQRWCDLGMQDTLGMPAPIRNLLQGPLF